MTGAERRELGQLVRLLAKLARHAAEARGKWLLADAEAKLAAIYKAEVGWTGRGENGLKGRQAELRRVAQTQVAARVKEAQAEIDRIAVKQLTAIARTGLTSAEARKFIEAMPQAEDLMPPLGVLEMATGELVRPELAGTDAAPDETANETAGVTDAPRTKRMMKRLR
jgi:hypothetical protein